MYRSALILLVALLAALPVDAQPRTMDGLGTIHFPNSGNQAAQEPFYRGVLLLHSFEFGPARRAFRAAQEADPAFVLAYWGEAMAYNYPLWRQKDAEEARAVLARLGASPEARRARAGTEREALYLDAVEALFGPGTKQAQDLAYMEAMRLLHETWPDDDEARAFYALAILGSTNGERDFATYMRGAATAAPVFERNPDHPGAAHYLIHSFDDPIHAPLGLPAADAYSEIAPRAAHAQHMTSHIFVALGLWDRVVKANVRAMEVQDAERAASGQGPNTCGHYSSWLHYGHLMLGHWEDAEALMDACHADAVAGRGSWFYFTAMRARHVVDSGDWSLAGRWLAEPPGEDPTNNASVFGGAEFTYLATNAFAALQQGSTEPVEALLAGEWGPHPGRTLQLNQLRGLLAIRSGAVAIGVDLIREAAQAEAEIPFEFGPPLSVKPGFELLGEVLAAQGQWQASAEAFREAGLRTPGRRMVMSTSAKRP